MYVEDVLGFHDMLFHSWDAAWNILVILLMHYINCDETFVWLGVLPTVRSLYCNENTCFVNRLRWSRCMGGQ